MLCILQNNTVFKRDRTESVSVSVMGHGLSEEVSSTRLVWKQRNIFGRISLFWSMVLPGYPAQQNGGDHGRLIQTPMSILHIKQCIKYTLDIYDI